MTAPVPRPLVAFLDAPYSDFDPAGDAVSGGATLSLSHDTNLGMAARFVDAASSVFHLRHRLAVDRCG